jgi:hypothetical protein
MNGHGDAGTNWECNGQSDENLDSQGLGSGAKIDGVHED